MQASHLECARRPSLWSACIAIAVVATPAAAAIIGVTTNTATFTFFEGGTPYTIIGGETVAQYPAFTASGFQADTDIPPAGFGQLFISYLIDSASSRARVIIPDTGLASIASQGAPEFDDGAITSRVEFTIDFSIDAGGTPATFIPIAYPIAFGGTPGTSVNFDAEVSYDNLSDTDPAFGISELHFFDSGSGGIGVVSDADLAIPAITGPAILRLTGFFQLRADGVPGGSTEILVFGVPEPSTLLLLATGLFRMVIFGRTRRR